jgi:hypothetical protein
MRRGRSIALLTALGLLASGSLSAQDKPSSPRTLDLVTGVLLYCMPIAAEAWTKDLCAALDKEAATLAKTANVRFVALKTTDNDASNKQKARDAGFDPTNALWLLVKVQRMSPGTRPGWSISLQADANTLPHAVSKGQSQRLIFTQGATLDANVSPREAEKTGKTLIGIFFETFSKPVKPAAP